MNKYDRNYHPAKQRGNGFIRAILVVTGIAAMLVLAI